MGIVKMFYLFATAFTSSSREVFTEIMFVEILQNYAKKPMLESLF